MPEINVSCAGDPVHTGDKAVTRETPAQRERVNRYGIYRSDDFNRECIERISISCLITEAISLYIIIKSQYDNRDSQVNIVNPESETFIE